MPYQVKQMIEDKGIPVCVYIEDPVSKALSLMIEHDFSQLPVLRKDQDYEIPEGLITYEGILRGIRNFNARIDDLHVRDVMVSADIFSLEDDLFDILDRLKEKNAVLISVSGFPELVGIVTSYDATEYFRNRTEDMMRVEDIELIIKDFILSSYTNEDGNPDERALNNVIAQITANKKSSRELHLDDLTLGDCINLLLHKDTWSFFEPVFLVKREFINQLLQGVRQTRNELAHFRGDITAEQRDQLKFASEWLSKRQEEYEKMQEQEFVQKLLAEPQQEPVLSTDVSDPQENVITAPNFSITEAADGGGRYAVLADWLQSQPGSLDNIQFTFEEIEKIIGNELPASARNHRAWWANDSVGHSHSQQWLEAGWRRTYLNMSEEKVTFARIKEREKAYISFFSKLLEEFRNYPDFPIRDVSPDGASWMIVQTLPKTGKVSGSFSVSFTRGKKLRTELYLDTGDKAQTKAIFDKLIAKKEELEQQLGNIEWERLNNRRASRIALYHAGYILEEDNHSELIKWVAGTTDKFYAAIAELANSVILEVVGK